MPRAHVIDRARIWRLVAAVLMVAVAVTAIELWARPDAWRPSLLSAAFPLVGAPFAWRLGPRLTPTRSFRLGALFLYVGIVAVTISLIGWLGTPMTGAVSFYYVLITVFGALFFDRTHVIRVLSFSSIAMAVALLVDGFGPEDLLLWTLATSVNWSTGLILHDVRSTAERLSYSDALTGAANRREWDLVLDDAIRQHARTGDPLAMLVVDIDDFKSVNDVEGHERGDEVLRDAVAAWRHVLRQTDTLARLGGDEFGVLLPGVGLARARSIAEQMLSSIETATGTTCSIGVAVAEDSDGAALLPTSADQQLYAAKSAGRARVEATIVDPSGTDADESVTDFEADGVSSSRSVRDRPR